MIELLRVEHRIDLIHVGRGLVNLPWLLLSGVLHLLLLLAYQLMLLVRVLEVLLVGCAVRHMRLLSLHAVPLDACALSIVTICLAVATLHATSLLMAVVIVGSMPVALTLVLVPSTHHATIHRSLDMTAGLEVLSWTLVTVDWHRAHPALTLIANLQLVKEETKRGD